MLTRMFACCGRTWRALLYGPSGTLSLGRIMTVLMLANLFAILWLFVVWVGFVTVTDRMESAAPLASSIGTILSAVLSSSVAASAATWWTNKHYGAAGSATPEQVDTPPAPTPPAGGTY